jgi:hypothetical protein
MAPDKLQKTLMEPEIFYKFVIGPSGLLKCSSAFLQVLRLSSNMNTRISKKLSNKTEDLFKFNIFKDISMYFMEWKFIETYNSMLIVYTSQNTY